MIDAVTVAAALVGWWGAACRVGQMQIRTHRPGAVWWHWACGAICLMAVAKVLLGHGGPVVLGTALSMAAYIVITLPEWLPGPPAWAQKQTRERSST